MTPDDADYTTTIATLDPHRFLAVVMHYRKSEDDYIQTRCSRKLSESAARALAQSWAAAMKLEVR